MALTGEEFKKLFSDLWDESKAEVLASGRYLQTVVDGKIEYREVTDSEFYKAVEQ